jgi:nicotinate-nucleotide adenylyltransferase
LYYPLIGILGGTFNPIHFGHLRTAQEVAENLNLKEVKFIPSANPPHKPKPEVTAEQRAEMIKLSIKHNPLFNLDTIELNRLGPSYTIDTLEQLHSPEHALCLIVGTDVFIKFNTWHRWQELINYCHIILVERRIKHQQSALDPILESFIREYYVEDLSLLNQKQAGTISMQKTRTLEISSSEIRNLVSSQKCVNYLTTSEVIDYIKNESLYL